MSNKVKCLGCGNPILKKTSQKYQGYSRQCLAKKKQQESSIEEIINQDIQFFLDRADISFPTQALTRKYNQFKKIWSIREDSDFVVGQFLSRAFGLKNQVYEEKEFGADMGDTFRPKSIPVQLFVECEL